VAIGNENGIAERHQTARCHNIRECAGVISVNAEPSAQGKHHRP
jgi:hypothetical protein